MKFLIIINFKTYVEGTGKNAVKLAKICYEVSKKYNSNIMIAAQDADIYRITSVIKIPVIAQKIDPIEPGKHTGHTLPLAIKEDGAIGTLINHSENGIGIEDIGKCIKFAKKLKMFSVCCVHDLKSVKEITRFKPEFLAFEDPELIGTGRAISKVKPEYVKKFVNILGKINSNIIPICGAGISDGDDVKIAKDLGMNGVIISSAVVQSKNPKKILEDICQKIK